MASSARPGRTLRRSRRARSGSSQRWSGGCRPCWPAAWPRCCCAACSCGRPVRGARSAAHGWLHGASPARDAAHLRQPPAPALRVGALATTGSPSVRGMLSAWSLLSRGTRMHAARRAPARRSGALPRPWGRRSSGRRRAPQASGASRTAPRARAAACGAPCVQAVCMRVPGKERIRAMRHLYALLQWTSRRLAELVRPRKEARRAGAAPRVPAARSQTCAREASAPALPGDARSPGRLHAQQPGLQPGLGRRRKARASLHLRGAGRARGGRARRRVAGQRAPGPAAEDAAGRRALPCALVAAGASPAGAQLRGAHAGGRAACCHRGLPCSQEAACACLYSEPALQPERLRRRAGGLRAGAGSRTAPRTDQRPCSCLRRLLRGRSTSTPSEAGACCRSPCRPWRPR